MTFYKLLANARKYSSVKSEDIDNDELNIPIYNVLNSNDYTKEETEFINNITDISKTIFDADKTNSKYELQIYEDILLDSITKDICIKFAKARIKKKCISHENVDKMNFLLNNDDFIDFFANYLKNFKIKIKILNNINDFLKQKIDEDMIDQDLIESLKLINNSCIIKFDKDIASSHSIIDEYINKILESDNYVDFNLFLSSLFESILTM